MMLVESNKDGQVVLGHETLHCMSEICMRSFRTISRCVSGSSRWPRWRIPLMTGPGCPTRGLQIEAQVPPVSFAFDIVSLFFFSATGYNQALTASLGRRDIARRKRYTGSLQGTRHDTWEQSLEYVRQQLLLNEARHSMRVCTIERFPSYLSPMEVACPRNREHAYSRGSSAVASEINCSGCSRSDLISIEIKPDQILQSHTYAYRHNHACSD